MSIPDQKFVKVKLTPYEKDLTTILREAFQDWREITEKKLLTLGRTRAGIIHDRALSLANKLLPDKGVKIEDKYETAQFNVDDELLFRFKKGDNFGLSRNYRTSRALPITIKIPLYGHPFHVLKLYIFSIIWLRKCLEFMS